MVILTSTLRSRLPSPSVFPVEPLLLFRSSSALSGLIQSQVKHEVQKLKTVPVYLAIFVFGMLFEVVVAMDAVR